MIPDDNEEMYEEEDVGLILKARLILANHLPVGSATCRLCGVVSCTPAVNSLRFLYEMDDIFIPVLPQEIIRIAETIIREN
ncbi:hypothetical protein [Micromonospora zhanjiangensis]|uniref:Uncharacterized protein n=1 Tax=Micromonospora zhanjiangensis TaxID=1522057 RepID=A0ABV8KHJ9_9ACTN